MKEPELSEPPAAGKAAIREPVRWAVRRLRGEPRFWWSCWTPPWSHGRGSYISIGCGLFGVYRGY